MFHLDVYHILSGDTADLRLGSGGGCVLRRTVPGEILSSRRGSGTTTRGNVGTGHWNINTPETLRSGVEGERVDRVLVLGSLSPDPSSKEDNRTHHTDDTPTRDSSGHPVDNRLFHPSTGVDHRKESPLPRTTQGDRVTR